MTGTAVNREKRDADTRDADMRETAWAPPSSLPTPEPKDGFEFRWIRLTTLNENDVRNIHMRLREGWVPVTKKECPEIVLLVDESAKFKDNIVVGGLMLCKAPVEMTRQRNAHYQRATAAQMDAVDNNFMRENDARMPLFKDRKSTITFGRGE